LGIAMLGAPSFFKPRLPSPLLFPFGGIEALSHYDVAPLKETIERLVDFERISAVASLRHPEVLQRPDNPEGIRIFDFGELGGR
jgi:hypothetical protein